MDPFDPYSPLKFLIFYSSSSGYRKKRKIVKDKKKLHGVVDKSSSEQHFCKSDTITFVVRKIWSHAPSASGSYGRQSDEILNFLNSLQITSVGFSWRLKVQCYYGVTNAFQSVFLGKVYCEVCYWGT